MAAAEPRRIAPPLEDLIGILGLTLEKVYFLRYKKKIDRVRDGILSKQTHKPLRVVQISDSHLFASLDGRLLGLCTEDSLKLVLDKVRISPNSSGSISKRSGLYEPVTHSCH